MNEIATLQQRINDEADAALRKELSKPYAQLAQALSYEANLTIPVRAWAPGQPEETVNVRAMHALNQVVEKAFLELRDGRRRQATADFLKSVESFQAAVGNLPSAT